MASLCSSSFHNEKCPPAWAYGRYSREVDWWTIGVLIFEMLVGLPPFYDENTQAMYQKVRHRSENLLSCDMLLACLSVLPLMQIALRKILKQILHQRLVFPDAVSPAAAAIVTRLLDRDPRNRLGHTGAAAIRADPFFSSLNWDDLLYQRINMPFKPELQGVRCLLFLFCVSCYVCFPCSCRPVSQCRR